MSQRQYITLVGVFIIILPVLGLPLFVKQVLFTAIGALIIVYAFRIHPAPHHNADTFSDSHNHPIA